jgi:lambda repressor-like predicted transcriptional regulator
MREQVEGAILGRMRAQGMSLGGLAKAAQVAPVELADCLAERAPWVADDLIRVAIALRLDAVALLRATASGVHLAHPLA